MMLATVTKGSSGRRRSGRWDRRGAFENEGVARHSTAIYFLRLVAEVFLGNHRGVSGRFRGGGFVRKWKFFRRTMG
jgi:hypothetical protein